MYKTPKVSASEMTCIVSGGALNSTHSGLRAVRGDGGRKLSSPIDLAHGLCNNLYNRTCRDGSRGRLTWCDSVAAKPRIMGIRDRRIPPEAEAECEKLVYSF